MQINMYCIVLYCIVLYIGKTYNKLSNDKCRKEKEDGKGVCGSHTVPQGLDPFSTQDSKHHHKRVEEIAKIPPWDLPLSKHFCGVRFTKNICSKNGKYIGNKDQNQGDIR